MKVKVTLKKSIYLTLDVRVPDDLDTEEAHKKAYEEAIRYIDENDSGRLCAHCTGWGQPFSIDEEDEWLKDDIKVEE